MEYLATPYEPFVEALLGGDRTSSLERELRGLAAERSAAPEVERTRRFRLVEDHLRRRASSAGAVVIELEDVQWSDAATLELWRYLAQRLADAPVVMIATYRDDEIASDAMRVTQLARARREGALDVTLGPIGSDDMRLLLASVATGERPLEPAESAAIVELAEGRPLIAEELLRSLLDGARSPTGLPAIPGSVKASIVERLRGLAPAEQDVLLAGAVIGRDFDAALVAGLTGTSEREILAALRRARNLQLVVEMPATESFRFRHAITRETLYGELLLGEARRMHRGVAQLLEAAGGERHDEIAYHWWAAGDAARALASNEAAGDRFVDMYAYADAARAYERALDFANDESRENLVRKVSFALCAIGEMGRARSWCQIGARELRRAGQEHAALGLMLWAARQLYESGEVERALETIELVRVELADTADSPIHYTAAMTLAGILATLGRAGDALAVLDEAERIDCARGGSDRFRAHNARGNALFALGSSAAARAEYASALAIADEIDSNVLRVHALGNSANAALLTGAPREAAHTYASALDLARRHGLHRHASMLEFDAGLADLYAGNLAAALAAFRRSPANRFAAPMSAGFAWAIGLRLRGLVDADDVDALDVEGLAGRSLEFRESQLVAAVAGAAARAALECGERERAGALLAAALPAVTEPDHAYWLCDAAGEIAGDELARAARALLARWGDDDGNPAARAFLTLFDARRAGSPEAARAASRAFEALGFPIEAALAAEAAGDLERALALFERIGAARAVRRLRTGSVLPAAAAAAARLTRREREVARLAAQGYANRSIASEIGIGERTVETHLAVAYRKLGVHSRVELAAVLRAETAS